MTGYVSVLAICMPKPTQILVSCDLRYGKCGILQFGSIEQLTYQGISLSAELLDTKRLLMYAYCIDSYVCHQNVLDEVDNL